MVSHIRLFCSSRDDIYGLLWGVRCVHLKPFCRKNVEEKKQGPVSSCPDVLMSCPPRPGQVELLDVFQFERSLSPSIFLYNPAWLLQTKLTPELHSITSKQSKLPKLIPLSFLNKNLQLTPAQCGWWYQSKIWGNMAHISLNSSD